MSGEITEPSHSQVMTWLSQGGINRSPRLESAIEDLMGDTEVVTVNWAYGQQQLMQALETMPESEISGGQARAILADIRQRLNIVTEINGLYAEFWKIYISEGNEKISTMMEKIERFSNDVNALSKEAFGSDSLRPGIIRQIEYASQVMETIPAALSRGEVILRETQGAEASETPENILKSMKAGNDPALWANMSKKLTGTLRKGDVLGPGSTIAKLTAMIHKYHSLWNSMGTDGLKGASMQDIKKLEMQRVAIADVIAKSGSMLLQICCSEGTQFFEYIKSLASQSCESRDVQNFVGWWDKHRKDAD